MSDGTPIIIKKKKSHGGHAHHGGSWKVAYADFVTAMMAFFMVMWIMGLSDDAKAQIQGYFQDPFGFKANQSLKTPNIVTPKTSPNSTNSQQRSKVSENTEKKRLRTLASKIQTKINSDAQLKNVMHDIEITVSNEGLRIELVESRDAAFFESGSAVLNQHAIEVVKKLAPVLGSSQRDLIVEGHTDSVPYPGTTYDNWNLSADRANSLRRALVQTGVHDKQIVGVRALADTQLKIPDDPTNPRNRRVAILLPFHSSTTTMPKDEIADGLGALSPAPVQKP